MSGLPIFQRLIIYLFPPLIVVVAVFVLRVLYVQKKRREQEEQLAATQAAEAARVKEEEARNIAILEQKRFTLEILSLGVAVEYMRQTEIWDEIQGQEAVGSILSAEQEDYPTTLDDKERAHRERESEVLENILGWLNDEWAIPAFLVGPSLHNPQMMAVIESNLAEALDYGEIQGRRFRVVESIHDESPDFLMQKIFDFMERNPEIPAVLLVAEDGQAVRHYLRSEDEPELLYDGPRPPDGITETVVGILLGRKDRIEAMRSFTRTDPTGADPMTPYWEKDPKRGKGEFRTTEWLPTAWSRTLIEQFSDLTVLGRLHRPQYAVFQGESPASRATSMKHAWNAALESLENPGRNQHLIYDYGDVDFGRRIVPLTRAMAGLDPEFDVIEQGTNVHRCLGDTGAATPFLGLALAVMASSQEKCLSTSVFLRREDGASLFLISPAPEPEEPSNEVPSPAKDEHVLA